MTSYPSIHTDLLNAGANWVDREVVTDANFITSRKPEDIPAFSRAITQTILQLCLPGPGELIPDQGQWQHHPSSRRNSRRGGGKSPRSGPISLTCLPETPLLPA